MLNRHRIQRRHHGVLKDLGRSQSNGVRVVLGAAVIDDVLGLVILAVVSGTIIAANRGGSIAAADGGSNEGDRLPRRGACCGGPLLLSIMRSAFQERTKL